MRAWFIYYALIGLSLAAATVACSGRGNRLVGSSVSNPLSKRAIDTSAAGRCIGTLLLSTASVPNVGTEPRSVTSGDFNGDGKLDLVTANKGKYIENGGDVSVLLGHGDGTFQRAVNYAVGSGAASVTSGDFNGDSKLDLATANYGTRSNNVSVLLGNGDGTFQPAVNNAVVGTQPSSVASGDFNGDGMLDLATANSSNNVSVFLGRGDGSFESAVSYAAGSPNKLISGDFNGDGKVDLVIANCFNVGGGGRANVSVLLGNGDGTFQAAVNYGGDVGDGGDVGELSTVTSGDFNRDGKLDLAYATFGGRHQHGGIIGVLLANQDGTFQRAVNYAIGYGAASVMSGDFNGDGKLDLATANYGGESNSASVLLGNGDGTFQSVVNYAVGTKPASVTSGDFNGDGKLDLATANSKGNNVSVLLNTGCL